MGCLAEDELYELTRAGALAAAPAVEAHLGACPACSALVAALVAGDEAAARDEGWGALVGRTLGPYRLDAQIGAGAMGAVYRGWDPRLCRHVAVKVLAGVAGERTRRLDGEARAAAAIAHPNVVAVHDVGTADGLAYVVTELIDGESLRSVLGAGAVAPARALRLGLELARGLAAAHAAGVVHRDLKPENILVARDGVLKILDFGLAKRTDLIGGLDATEPGTVCGTVGYMAPEQARGEAVDGRADLFAAGAILFELVTGRRAFDGASHAERMSAVLRDTPGGLDEATLGPLGPVIARCLAKDPAARFQSAPDLAWVLEDVARRGGDGAAPRPGPTEAAPGTAPAAPGAAASASRPSRRAILLGAGAALVTGAAGFALGRAGRRAGAPRPPALQQLTFRQGRVLNARFARDGASVFFGAAWDDEPLAAYALRLGGGVPRALEVPPADVLAVSRGALAIAIDRRHVDGQCATGRLALAPIDGGVPRVLADEVQEADFSPDGNDLAAVVRTARGFRLEAPLGHALLEVPGWITHPRWSPDGRRVACLLHPHANDDAGDLVVVDRATGAVTTVSPGWSSIAGLAWSARGDRLWFTAARDGASNALRVIAPGGRDRLVFETLGRLRLHDRHDDHRLLVSRDVWRLRTMLGGGGGGPERDRSFTEFSLVVALAADGSSLLVGELGDTPEVNGIYVVPAAGGARLRLGPGLPRAWSRDGARVFGLAYDAAAQRLDPTVYATRGGERTPIAIDPVASVPWAAWQDDRRLVIGGRAPDRPPRLWRIEAGGRGATPLTAEGDHGVGAIDPAARQVAFVDPDGALRLLPLDGAAAPRTIAGGLADHVVCAWRDDATVLVRTTTTPIEIRAVDVATGAVAPHRRITPPAVGLKAVDAVVLASAADRYAYSYGQELSELFSIDLRGA